MKRFLISLIILLLTAAILIFLIISQDNTYKCTEHKDYNGDLMCDVCSAEIALPHTVHEDSDLDNKCDICYKELENSESPEKDETPTPPCESCIDGNEDGTCDACGKTLEAPEAPDNTETPNTPCESCADTNEDGKCDACGKELESNDAPDSTEKPSLPCESCVDENNDGGCDVCGSEVPKESEPTFTVTVNGEDIKNHVIAYDDSNPENKLLATKIQELLYTKFALWLNLSDSTELTNGNYIIVKSADKSGGEGFYVRIKDKNLEIICEFPNKTVSAGESYFSSILEKPSEATALTEATLNVRDISYEDFGAIGDGKANDYEAIKRTHDYANQYGHTVVAAENAIYYIEPENDSVIIRTSVRWLNASFIIDDAGVSSEDSQKSIFEVASDYEKKHFDTENEYIKSINALGGLFSDIKRINLGLGYPALLIIENSNHKHVKYGENEAYAQSQNEIVIIDEDGFISSDTPITLDYAEITGITAFRIDDTPITISGGSFFRKANEAICDGSYYRRNILICRSNLTLEYIRYEITEESENAYITNPYEAFIDIRNSNNVTVSNCTLTAHKISYTDSEAFESRTLSIIRCNNVTVNNCFQPNFYAIDGMTPDGEHIGIIKSEYSKNLTIKDSTVSRLGIHLSVYNLKVLSSAALSIEAVGSGAMLIENAYVYSDTLLKLTEEYGSYWNGNILIKNSFMNTENEPTLIGGAWYNHDFGYSTYLPESIIIDNLAVSSGTAIRIFDNRFAENGESIMKDEIDGEQNLNKMLPTKNIIIKNNTEGYIFFMPETEYFNNTIITED